MKQVNTYEARTHLSRLLRLVAKGEEVIIANRGVPMARLVPMSLRQPKRKLGSFASFVKVGENFDTLPDEILDAFEGREQGKKKKS